MRELLEEMRSAAMELAQYASYAEIVNGISVNRSAVRKWCDKVYEIQKRIVAKEGEPAREAAQELNVTEEDQGTEAREGQWERPQIADSHAVEEGLQAVDPLCSDPTVSDLARIHEGYETGCTAVQVTVQVEERLLNPPEADNDKEPDWCMCTVLKGVARDGWSTCTVCGGQDAYGSSIKRPVGKEKVLDKNGTPDED